MAKPSQNYLAFLLFAALAVISAGYLIEPKNRQEEDIGLRLIRELTANNDKYTKAIAIAKDIISKLKQNEIEHRTFRADPCKGASCYPATGNLLTGRTASLTASSTCGLNGPEPYCIVDEASKHKNCYTCDSTNEDSPNQHTIDQVFHRIYSRTSPRRTWWQSENGVEKVQIQLDLESKMHFTHLVVTFKNPRPAAMLIERSADFGKTWQVYRYFAEDCEASFPGIQTGPPQALTDVICESRFSKKIPATDGELIFRVLPRNINIDPNSPEVADLLTITNLRLNFTKMHEVGDGQESNYYSIYEMVIRGAPLCNGHATRSLQARPITIYPMGESPPYTRQDMFRMVDSQCDCVHNTQGTNCEQCADGFYARQDRRINDWDVCQACDCDPMGSIDNQCASNGETAGQCNCKAGFTGMKCDQTV